MSIEASVGEAVIEELKARGHNLSVTPDLTISGCSTVVMIDPDTGSRIAGADPRRDCYAMAY